MTSILSRFFPNKQKTQSEEISLPVVSPLDMSKKKISSLKTKKQIYEWIQKGIAHYHEWYQPIDFGNGVIAYETRPPSWEPVMDSLSDIGGGIAKWNFILKKHIPDLKGKRVLDLGCSVGVMSMQCSRLGAKEVIGIDRDASGSYHSTTSLPPQNIVEQAMFVKTAFELLEKRKFPIRYLAQDIGNLDASLLGNFDCILALCVVYHELEGTDKLVQTLSSMTDYLVLQANQVHTGKLGMYSDKMYLAGLLDKYGFTSIEIDAPSGYMLPVIVGKRGNID